MPILMILGIKKTLTNILGIAFWFIPSINISMNILALKASIIHE